jgi:hypothetical protein
VLESFCSMYKREGRRKGVKKEEERGEGRRGERG